MISLNRVTRLIHKTRFKARQRKAVSYFSKYVLSDKDIDSSGSERSDEEGKMADFLELSADTGMLFKGFDPENDAWDRRLLYEVTGMRLDEQDYRGDDTSSDEDDESILLTENG